MYIYPSLIVVDLTTTEQGSTNWSKALAEANQASGCLLDSAGTWVTSSCVLYSTRVRNRPIAAVFVARQSVILRASLRGWKFPYFNGYAPQRRSRRIPKLSMAFQPSKTEEAQAECTPYIDDHVQEVRAYNCVMKGANPAPRP